MSDTTKIEWATHTFNPWEGCTKVSPGCANCYAEARNHRFGMDNWGKGKPRRRTSAATWHNPVKWDRHAGQSRAESRESSALVPRPSALDSSAPRIFPSLCDWLDDEVPIEWLADFLKLIHETPNLDWLLLTKRPENWLPRLNAVAKLWACDGGYRDTPEAKVYHDLICTWRNGYAPPHIWIGTSIEDQPRADQRIPELLEIPAAVRFLSVEPLLGPVNLRHRLGFQYVDGAGIDWAIIGGESGPRARVCNVEWIRSLVQQCEDARVPCFVKQLGSNARLDTLAMPHKFDMRRAFKHPKGGDPAEWPADLRVRQLPANQPSTLNSQPA